METGETTKYNQLCLKSREVEGWEASDLLNKDLSIKHPSSDQTGTHASSLSCRSYKPTQRTVCMILFTAQPVTQRTDKLNSFISICGNENICDPSYDFPEFSNRKIFKLLP